MKNLFAHGPPDAHERLTRGRERDLRRRDARAHLTRPSPRSAVYIETSDRTGEQLRDRRSLKLMAEVLDLLPEVPTSDGLGGSGAHRG